jgi:glyceraldehyde 3-phosphate dehydrogenase
VIDRNVSCYQFTRVGAFMQKTISIFDSVEIAQAILALDHRRKLDIGKLTYEYHLEDNELQTAALF